MKRFELIFLLLIFFTPFLPGLSSIDPMATQWLYLSIVFLGYFIFKFFFLANSNKLPFVFNYSLFSFILLIFFASLSFYSSQNIAESFIDLSRLCLILFCLIIFTSILFNSDFKSNSFFKFFNILLLLECIYFFINLYVRYYSNSTIDYTGITANVNIQSFSILLKLPLLIFSFRNKYISSLFFYITAIPSLSIIFLISSRGALLTLVLLFIFILINDLLSRQGLLNKLYSLFFPLIFSSLFTFFYVLPSFSTVSKISTLSLINKSTTDRLSFYYEAISTIFQYPFSGIGIGNWKIYGIFTHREIMSSYTTPYHAHNDFLQVGAETGIFGMLCFISFLFIPVFYIYKLRNNKFFKPFYIPFALTFLVYFIDSFFNFPLSRPLIQVQILFIISTVFYFNLENSKLFFFNKLWLFLSTIILLLIVFSSYKVYNSYSKQNFLLSDFNSQNFDTPLDIINSIDDEYPNITATALPIKAIKANYFASDSIISKLLDASINDNPYIKYPQSLKAIRFNTNSNIDSALFYARDAYNGIPNNELHILTYMSVLSSLKDSITLDSLFSVNRKLNSANVWNAYLRNLLIIDLPFYESRYSTFKEAMDLFPKDSRFEYLKSAYFMGDSLIDVTSEMLTKASFQFDKKNYTKSAEIYMEASKYDPSDPSYLENAGQAYFLSNNINKASKLLDSVINHYPNSTGKAHYMKGLLLINSSGNKQESCRLFNIALKRGNPDAQKAIKLFCK